MRMLCCCRPPPSKVLRRCALLMRSLPHAPDDNPLEAAMCLTGVTPLQLLWGPCSWRGVPNQQSVRQAAAFALLGVYYQGVACDGLRARRCFERALTLDPQSAEAGAPSPMTPAPCRNSADDKRVS